MIFLVGCAGLDATEPTTHRVTVQGIEDWIAFEERRGA